MAPDQLVTVKEPHPLRDAVRKYLSDNAGWRAEDRDLVWSHRYVVAKLAMLAGKTMYFSDLEAQVRDALVEAIADQIRKLTPELIAAKMCDALPSPVLEPVAIESLPATDPAPAAESNGYDRTEQEDWEAKIEADETDDVANVEDHGTG